MRRGTELRKVSSGAVLEFVLGLHALKCFERAFSLWFVFIFISVYILLVQNTENCSTKEEHTVLVTKK